MVELSELLFKKSSTEKQLRKRNNAKKEHVERQTPKKRKSEKFVPNIYSKIILLLAIHF